MPGFIAYLHPVDDTHLLGIGREVNFTPAGEMAQVKIALLDVSDLSDPKAQAVQLIGEGFASSDALWDPKAFTWLPAQKMLAIPFVDFGSQTFVSDLRLFQIDPAGGTIQARGSSLDGGRVPDVVGRGLELCMVPVDPARDPRRLRGGSVRVRHQRRGRALGEGGKLAGVAADGEVSRRSSTTSSREARASDDRRPGRGAGGL